MPSHDEIPATELLGALYEDHRQLHRLQASEHMELVATSVIVPRVYVEELRRLAAETGISINGLALEMFLYSLSSGVTSQPTRGWPVSDRFDSRFFQWTVRIPREALVYGHQLAKQHLSNFSRTFTDAITAASIHSEHRFKDIAYAPFRK